MKLTTEHYLAQNARWPQSGQHILAQHDDTSVIVYQAYRPSTGKFAIANGRLGGPDFSFNRMSWIKPNFLWMMYRSGWGTKPGQEVTLGLRIRRAFFERLLAQAVPSAFRASQYDQEQSWKEAVAASDVRLQWDPDHAPDGSKVERRAVQLGLRGDALSALATNELLEVIDMSAFVAQQRLCAVTDIATLQTPVERVFDLSSPSPSL